MPKSALMSGILAFSHHRWPAKFGPFVRTDSVKFTANSTIGDSEIDYLHRHDNVVVRASALQSVDGGVDRGSFPKSSHTKRL